MKVGKNRPGARKEAYIAHINPQLSPSIRLVSCADKLHNIRSIITDYRTHGEELWNRFSGGRETLWYYRALALQFANSLQDSDTAGIKALVAELQFAVVELERITKNTGFSSQNSCATEF